MKKLSEHQIVSILKEAEVGIPIKELCRKYGMAVSTFYKWRVILAKKVDKSRLYDINKNHRRQ
ncbi:transposase, partial [Gilliamella apicola]|uniref:transposase n=1 Tax=Gilliamella apicola TaxID=1196095 RepID=UPI002FEE25EB